MFITIDLRSLTDVLPKYRDYINVYLSTSSGLKKLSSIEILKLMEKMNLLDLESYCLEEEYFESYHKKIKITVRGLEDSKATDEINSQLQTLAIFKAVGGENPITDSPLPEHLAYLESFYNPVVMDSDIHPDFLCDVRKIFKMKVTEKFNGSSNRVVLFCCLHPVKMLKLRASSLVWLARGVTEYKIELTPGIIFGATRSRKLQRFVFHNTVLKILIWNCRNASTSSFKQNFIELVTAHSASLVILTETKMHSINATETLISLGFDSWEKVDSAESGGGIWILWKTKTVLLKDIARMNDEIHAKINIINEASTSQQTE